MAKRQSPKGSQPTNRASTEETVRPEDAVARQRHDLISRLSTLMEDDDLLDLMNAADESTDCIAVLQDQLQRIEESQQHEQRLERIMIEQRLSIIPKTTTAFDRKLRAAVTQQKGFVVSRRDSDVVRFAGKTMSWCEHLAVVVGFDTELDAKRAILNHYGAMDEAVKAVVQRHTRHKANVDRIHFDMPIVRGIVPQRPYKFTMDMDPQMAAAVEAIYWGLRVQNVEINDKPVASPQDVIRVLLHSVMAWQKLNPDKAEQV